MQRLRLSVFGTVQGVGFRPHAHRLARRLALTGAVGNDDRGVWCEVQGAVDDLDEFVGRLAAEAPPLARIEGLDTQAVDVVAGEQSFEISLSTSPEGRLAVSVPPDVAPCAACRQEIDDPADRRHRYAFTCCTNCGPRFTVVRGLPYDRARTSLAEFEPCDACAAEYADPADRRHHAQALCCADCGPTLTLAARGQHRIEGDPITQATTLIADGAIVAVKGMGGYQFVCRADDETVVERLRRRKHRAEKPFALLVASLEAARQLVHLDEASARALRSPEAPIVLAPRRAATAADDSTQPNVSAPEASDTAATPHQISAGGVGGRSAAAVVADSVAPGNRSLGVMLPATPLHALLAAAARTPLVCTSGNLSDEPIVIDDGQVETRLGAVADAVLSHDRRIERRADDSVGTVAAGRFRLLRRARGHAPRPVRLGHSGPTVLGVGAELKSTVSLAVDRHAHLSVHLGDLEHPAALAAFEEALADLLAVTGTTPELVVHDLHPEYLSTKFAHAVGLAPALGAQHHHAHLAACLADNGHAGPAIGMAFDGLGWGADGTLWGGEFLIGDAAAYQRGAHLRAVPMPGGTAAILGPWRMGVAHLVDTFGADLPDLEVLEAHAEQVPQVVEQCRPGRALTTSSVGRLFDAVAALCGLARTVTYEGQAAIVLEQAAAHTPSRYGVDLIDAEPALLDSRPLIAAIVADLRAGTDVALIAGSFHRWVADATAAVVTRLRADGAPATVALSGGVFQNQILVELVVPLLERSGFSVLLHAQVPCNDGGISLGQVAIGRAQLAL